MSAIRNAGGANKKKHLNKKKKKVKQKPKIKRKPTMAEELQARLRRIGEHMRGPKLKKARGGGGSKKKKKQIKRAAVAEEKTAANEPMADYFGGDIDTSENSSSEDWSD